MSWQLAAVALLAAVIGTGFVWFERSRPSARIVAAVAAMAALGVAGRLALAPIPNVVATTDVALLAGYALGGGPGFAVGALSGLVSNFWLGQGPWTPWQMAGWGMVGIAGAVLAAASGRRLGRLQLALAGAVAGLAFGALLDLSVMVNFGGEQSLERYLALSVRGVPFNIAHATGNFALMLAAGPAIVRMLDRYRERFEHRWSDAPLGRAAAALLIALCLAAPLLGPQPSAAKGGSGDARDWLLAAQNDDGGYGTDADASSSPGMTGWAMLGLEAAGVNPRDVSSIGGLTPVAYLRSNASEITSTGDLERTILALEAAGVDARQFQGRDLVAELRDAAAGDGSFGHQVNLTAFAILAQRAAGDDGSSVGKSASWLRAAQNRNGGWGSVKDAESEPDSTGAVVQALAVAPGGSGQQAAGAGWLERAQRTDGGWSLTQGASSNTQSTAWALQGLIAGGRAPGTIAKNGSNGIDFIAAGQSGDGHFAYSKASDQTPVWVTAQGLTGTARAPFPIAAVDRAPADPAPTSGTDSGAPAASAGSTPSTAVPSSDPNGYTGGDLGSSGIGGGGSDYGSGVYGTGSDDGSYPGLGGYGDLGDGNPGGGAGSAGAGGSKGAPADAGPSGPQDATGRDRIAANPDGSGLFENAAAAVALPVADSPLPSTLVFIGGLALLAAALGAGFLRYRKRLP